MKEKPDIKLYLLILVAAALPLTVSKYFFNASELPKSTILLLIGGLLIFTAVFSLSLKLFKEKKILISSAGLIDYGVLLFLAALIISTIFSLRPGISFYGQYERQFGLITYLYIIAVYFITGSADQINRKKALLLVMETVSVIISVYAGLQIIEVDPFGLQPDYVSRTIGTLGSPVFLGGFLILSFPFSLFNVSEKKNKAVKIAFPFIIFTGIILSGTRTAYISLAIQLLFVYLFFIKDRRFKLTKSIKQTIGILSLFTIFVFAFMVLYNDFFYIKRLFLIFNFNNPRLILWNDSLKVFWNYPLTGCGIAMFPAALEEVYSNALRYTDALFTYDNAHNNYLHILCTAGITGFAAYLFMLYGVFKTAAGRLNKNDPASFEGKLNLAVLIMASGYAVYGLINFDDITITLYLFLYLGIFRTLVLKPGKTLTKTPGKFSIIMVFIILSTVIIYNGYRSVNNLFADRDFLLANLEYVNGNFPRCLELNNKAIMMNPDCSAYRFTEASEVYDYCFENTGLKEESKQKLLQQVEGEISRIKQNLYYINYSNGLLSLVFYEEGRKEEAEKLKNEVLAKDTMNINFRIKLARYLLRENRMDEAYRSISLILLVKPNELTGNLLAAIYYRKIEDRENAVRYSILVISNDPKNKTALDILRYYGVK